MKVTFIGVGEAVDEYLPNTSILLESGEQSLLLDCGFNAGHAFFRYAQNPDNLNAVWVSHFHGDHFFGIPALVIRFHVEGRTAPLVFVGQSGLEAKVKQCIDLAYPGLRDKIGFVLKFAEVHIGERLPIGEFMLETALADHGKQCLALRVEANGKAVFYSGDGKPTEDTARLADKVDLLIHESFVLGEWEGHGSVAGSIEFAQQAGAKRFAAVHVNVDVRHDERTEVLRLLTEAQWVDAFLPDPGDTVEL